MPEQPFTHLAVGVCKPYNVRVHLEWNATARRVQLNVFDAEPLRERRTFRAECEELPTSTPDEAWLNALTYLMLQLIEMDGPVTMFLGDKAAVAKFVAMWGDYEWLPEKLAQF
ncbi:hypothetical protein AB0F96_04060 [Streptomyces sp. NPDC023998]|uniref:hypothetical protein n=1 Tax=Streptomyces sp. NPDC023998 TaxID=3154597 RepID=UPI0034086E3C